MNERPDYIKGQARKYEYSFPPMIKIVQKDELKEDKNGGASFPVKAGWFSITPDNICTETIVAIPVRMPEGYRAFKPKIGEKYQTVCFTEEFNKGKCVRDYAKGKNALHKDTVTDCPECDFKDDCKFKWSWLLYLPQYERNFQAIFSGGASEAIKAWKESLKYDNMSDPPWVHPLVLKTKQATNGGVVYYKLDIEISKEYTSQEIAEVLANYREPDVP